MDLNNNLANMKLKVRCDLCEKSFFGEFLSKHVRIAHPGVKKPNKKKNWHIPLQPMESDFKFFCKFCKKGFAIKEKLKSHKKRLHLSKKNKNSKAVEKLIWKKLKLNENGQVHCNDCNKTLSQIQTARKHYKRWHMAKNDGSTFVCKLCNEGFTTKYFLMNHLQEIHSKTKILKRVITRKNAEDLTCQLCKTIYGSRSSLDSHMLAHIVYKHLEFMENDHVKCFDCNQTFLSIVSAKKHCKDMHMAYKNSNKFICQLCNEEFEVKCSLKQHFKDIHGLQHTKNAKDLTCQICKKICRCKSNLDSHVRACSVYKQLEATECGGAKCLDCNKIFASIGGARKHFKNWHMSDKNGKKFVCKLCNEEFEIQHSLKQHFKDIHGLPPKINYENLEATECGGAKCIDCNKSFSSTSGARAHYRNLHLADSSISHGSEKHSVEKNKWNQLKPNENGCIDCLTCKKTFASFANAKQHFKEQHLANQKFTCVTCGKVFNYKRNMMRHNQIFHQNASLKNQLIVIDRVNVEFNDEKHEAIEGEHVISTKKQATKSIEKPENAKLTKDEENLKIKKVVEKGIDFVTSDSSETFDEDFLKTVEVFEKASELGKNPTPVNQNIIKAEVEVEVEIKEEHLKDLHLVHDNSEQNEKLTEGEENGKLKEEMYFDEVHEELGIDFVTSNTFDREYLKSTESQEEEKTKSIEKPEKSHILCPNCHKPFASCKKWCFFILEGNESTNSTMQSAEKNSTGCIYN